MAAVTIILPRKVLEDLEGRAASEDKSLEELVGEAVLKGLEIEDPQAKVELHLRLCEKYLVEGEELLRKGDYAQASEKFWGSASQSVKAVAAKRGVELRSHRELHEFVVKLEKELGDPEVRRLWQSAGMLHQNFYENWLPPEMVTGNADDVKKFVEKLKRLLPG